MPWLRVLVLAFAFAHATGLSDAIEVACDEACEEEGACDDGCPPICASCSCARCPVATAVTSTVMAPVRPPLARVVFADVAGMPASPDRLGILRVPIAAA